MKYCLRLLGALLFLGMVAWNGTAESAPPLDRVAAWRQDLQAMRNALSGPSTIPQEDGPKTLHGQKDFARVYPPERFDASLREIEQEIPRLSDEEIALRLKQLMASAHVAHNAVFSGKPSFQKTLLLDLTWLADGVVVGGASPEFADSIGSRIVRVGDQPVEEVLRALDPYASYETEAWRRVRVVRMLQEQAMLRHLDLLDEQGRVRLTLESAEGKQNTLAVPFAPGPFAILSPSEARREPAPLAERHLQSYYWFETLFERHALYLQYNRCANDPAHPMDSLVREITASLDAHPVQRTIVDLRWNEGGDSSILQPLIEALKPRRQQTGKVYVLIGPHTFSSGLLNAMDLRKRLHARLVGEATGGSLSGYGEVEYFRLPNSKLLVQYTTKYFRLKNRNASLEPDLPAVTTAQSLRERRDVALEAALAAR
jgi:hypothetical protein